MVHYRHRLNAHERSPESVRNVYKKYQKTKGSALDDDRDILDFCKGLTEVQESQIKQSSLIQSETLNRVYNIFCNGNSGPAGSVLSAASSDTCKETLVYEHVDVPGLQIIPSLISPKVQRALLSRLLHRDLSNSAHKTNVHMHYSIPNPPSGTSFFTPPPSSTNRFEPLDPSMHKPISVSQFLNKKLRWVTLGGQYDWTNKVYPASPPPPFPQDIAALLEGIFPDMKAQAAIANFYSPGDTLSVHRDVSEECDRGLVSISIGCDALFVVGLEADAVSPPGSQPTCQTVVMRLRSGDALYMTGKSRFAWHGVPQIIPNTCPEWLRDWPASPVGGESVAGENDEQNYEQWRAWMASKRVNLNVRQMWD